MKNIFFALILGVSLLSFSQDKGDVVPFAVIEKVPVYPGCDENMPSQPLKDCMSSEISSLVSRNFNIKVVENLGLPEGRKNIYVSFKINKEGNIVAIQARGPHVKLEEEAIRVIKLLPKMDKPGYVRDKPVIVPYSLPITFELKNAKKKPLTKRQKRKREKQKKKVSKN